MKSGSWAALGAGPCRALAAGAADALLAVACAAAAHAAPAAVGMLEAGAGDAGSCASALAKALAGAAAAALGFLFTGFAFMFGNGSSGLVGAEGFFLSGTADNAVSVALQGFQYSGSFTALADFPVPLAAKVLLFSAAAALPGALAGAALAGRGRLTAAAAFSFVAAGGAVGVVGHWAWGGGWLAGLGFVDFAGGAVVHMLGGVAALEACRRAGPRSAPAPARDWHNAPLAAQGALALAIALGAFHAGCTLALEPFPVAHVLLATYFSGSAGLLAALFADSFWSDSGALSLPALLRGLLAGVVSVSACCPFVSIPSAVLVGSFGGLLATLLGHVVRDLGLDDPVGIVPVCLGCGTWSVLAVGLFAEGPGTIYGLGPAQGLLLGGSAAQLCTQAAGALAVGAFSLLFSSLAWALLDRLIGLKSPGAGGRGGLDAAEHGRGAYDLPP